MATWELLSRYRSPEPSSPSKSDGTDNSGGTVSRLWVDLRDLAVCRLLLLAPYHRRRITCGHNQRSGTSIPRNFSRLFVHKCC